MKKEYALDKTPPAEMRRLRNAMDDAWIRAFLGRATVGHVATRWDAQPFVTPVSFWYDSGRHALFFHTNVTGRLRANAERHAEACFEACIEGKMLPSNVALEFSLQYESVVAFGKIRLVQDLEERRYALIGLIERYFPNLEAGREYRSPTEAEMTRTAVFAIDIESWSGKRNWPEKAVQSDDWPRLAE